MRRNPQEDGRRRKGPPQEKATLIKSRDRHLAVLQISRGLRSIAYGKNPIAARDRPSRPQQLEHESNMEILRMSNTSNSDLLVASRSITALVMSPLAYSPEAAATGYAAAVATLETTMRGSNVLSAAAMDETERQLGQLNNRTFERDGATLSPDALTRIRDLRELCVWLFPADVPTVRFASEDDPEFL